MDWKEIMRICDEEEQTIEIYNKLCEEDRLNTTNSSSVEFLTTTKYVESLIKENSSILELGAGTGAYSAYLAGKGFDVTAVELNERNISLLKCLQTKGLSFRVIKGNALALDCLPDKSFDAVLSFGPLYHMRSLQDRVNCLRESMRVLKNDGYIFIALINNDMVPMCEMQFQENYFASDCYDHRTFKMKNFPYVFHTLEEARSLIETSDIKIIKEVASDGLSRICAPGIDALDKLNFEEYLKYHFYMCENPNFLAASTHFLFIGKKAN